MEAFYESDWKVPSYMCDSAGRLSMADTFNLFMELATEHAVQMGCGWRAMAAKNLFWLTVKTKVAFAPLASRPLMGETIVARTWPDAPDRMRCLRHYELVRNGEVVAAGKTEWAVLNTETGKLEQMAGIYGDGFEFTREPSLSSPFVRVVDDFADIEPFASYTVRSSDIDLGGHMNNVAYVRAVLGSFSVAEQKAMQISEMDAIFRNQCFEGDKLTLQRRETEDGYDIRLAKDGKAMFLAHLVCNKL